MECEQQFSLSWNNFHGNVSRELSGLLCSGTLADVTLGVGGELLQAHRLVLAMCSPYFKRMFQTNPHHHPIVVLRDVTYSAMRDLLHFMYHGEVSVKREELTSFIATAELLQIKGLTNKETEEDEREQESPKKTTQEPSTQHRHPSDSEQLTSNEDISQTIEINRKMLQEKILRLNQLKRPSEQFLLDFYQMSKKSRSCENQNHGNQNTNQNVKFFNETPTDMTYNDSHKNSQQSDKTDNSYDVLDLKTECDDSDITVTDPAVQNVNKSFDETTPEHAPSKDMMLASHDDASGLSSIFMDLKSIVNGKFAFRAPFYSEENSKEHILTTIPQKMDGKKKYPQRSCRTCWKVGKRRDTRFMCGYCTLPLCKTPCFEIHAKNLTGSYEEFPLI